MSTFALNIAIIFILLLSSTTIKQCMCNNHNVVRCNEKDRGALLIFKQGIIDPSELLSTWSTEKDCCAWKGIHCDNITSRVTEIDFGPSVFSEDDQFLGGEISFSILQLEFLNYLDLSINKFDSISIPPSFHNFTHSSNLYYLDLSMNHKISMDNLRWLSPLSSLKYLNLSLVDLHKETNWLQIVNTLPSLLELQLRGCDFNNFMINPSLEFEINFTSLTTLDLSLNNFSSKLPKQLFNLTKDLTYIDLSFSNIYGEIPSSLSSLRNLSYLELSINQLQGSNLDWIGQLEHLQVLGLCVNMLSGSIPSTIGNLSSLVVLCIGANNLSGEISEITFSRLSKLEFLNMKSLSCTFQFDHEWIPPFQLNNLFLANTNQGPNFPSWIYTQKSLEALDLSSSGISFIDENKFWSFVQEISYLLLSNNSISGDISNVTLNSYSLLLDHNNFTGAPPHISPKVIQVDLSHNFFSGSIPHSWKNLKDLEYVDLSHNFFSGSIPHSWKNLKDLEYINLWNNRLSGQVLVHLSHLKALKFLNLEKNEFSGTIPISMSQNLRVIILRGNQFEGSIPPQLFNMSSLIHLDLADNKFSGYLPECVYNMTNMITPYVNFYVRSEINLFTKGQAYLHQIDSQRRTIDLSVNNFTGEVPLELFRLIQVQTLNLSHNNFTGTIPNIIGGMKNMESLDFSNNGFSREIPQSMALLNFLSYLNLSCNDFTGRIPTGTQLQSFDRSSYIENQELCGAPLKNCTREEENPTNAKPSRENEGGDPFKESVYLGMGVGFATGFWGICGSLLLIKKWRNACYQFFDRVFDQVYVTLMIKLKSFRNNSASAS